MIGRKSPSSFRQASARISIVQWVKFLILLFDRPLRWNLKGFIFRNNHHWRSMSSFKRKNLHFYVCSSLFFSLLEKKDYIGTYIYLFILDAHLYWKCCYSFIFTLKTIMEMREVHLFTPVCKCSFECKYLPRTRDLIISSVLLLQI